MMQGKADRIRQVQLAYVCHDEAPIADTISHMLRSLGFVTRRFTSLEALLTSVRSLPPKIVILDLVLGDTDAVEVIRKLAAIRFKGAVLLMSGREALILDAIQGLGTARGLTMLHGLSKPFRAADLKASIAAGHLPTPSSRLIPDELNLHEALRERWLRAWYQPKMSLKTRRFCGAEAMLCALHPELGQFRPGSFLPAGDDPINFPLFEFLFRETVRDWKRLFLRGVNLRFSVNVPRGVMHSTLLLPLIRKALPTERDFPGLILEIPADDLDLNTSCLKENVIQLRLCNVSLSLKHFGRNLAPADVLRDLLFSELKVHQSLVAASIKGESEFAACEAAVAVGRELGKEVCAEGVETAAELAAVRSLGFDTAQGFFFSQPQSAIQFINGLSTPAVTPGRRAAHHF